MTAAIVTLAGRLREVDVTESGCWLWTGCLNSRGYGVVSIGGRRYLVHRVSYEENVGPIPEGLTIDHVKDRGCTSKACWNPAHLEPVTRVENILRHARSLRKCSRGHDFRRKASGVRWCPTCEGAAKRARLLDAAL